MKNLWKRIGIIASLVLVVVMLLTLLIIFCFPQVLEEIVVAYLSEKTASLIGQRVVIGDLSFSHTGEVMLFNIRLGNPEGFPEGDLLKVKEVFLKINVRELLKGNIHCKRLSIDSPELTLMRNASGSQNISGMIPLLFSGTGKTHYLIETFTIRDGSIQFRGDPYSRMGSINFTVKNLSSRPDTKTTLLGSASFSGGSILRVDGWAYPQAEQRSFALTLSSNALDLSAFRKLFEQYPADLERATAALNVRFEGDRAEGIELSSEIRIQQGAGQDARNEVHDLIIRADARYDIQEDSVTIQDITLLTGNANVVTIRGMITEVRENPSYTAKIRIERLELSAFNIMKGVRTSGIITSSALDLRGTFDGTLPQITGLLRLRDGSLSSPRIDLVQLNGEVLFSSETGMSAGIEASGKLKKAGTLVFRAPADIGLSVHAKHVQKGVQVRSLLHISPMDVTLARGTRAAVKNLRAFITGTFRDKTFSGSCSIKTPGIRYADSHFKQVTADLELMYQENSLMMRNARMSAENFTASSDLVEIERSGGPGLFSAQARNLYVANPEQDTRAVLPRLSIALDTRDGSLLGDFSFSAHLFLSGGTGAITGRGQFDSKHFSLEIPLSNLAGGTIEMALKGTIDQGPFPIEVDLTAMNVNVAPLSRVISERGNIPYHLAGQLATAAVRARVEDPGSLFGTAMVQARDVSVVKTGTEQNLVSGVSLEAKSALKGSEIEFQADTRIGSISSALTGTVTAVTEKDHALNLRIELPETKITDMRSSFWNVFPDSLLYAGLDGSLSGDVSLLLNKSGLRAEGFVNLKNFVLEGEYGEYSAGPVNGTLPISYRKTGDTQEPVPLPSFRRSEFETVRTYYTEGFRENGYNKITIGSFSYGFRLLKNIDLWVQQREGVLNIGRLSATIFGGRLQGSAVIEVTDKPRYRAGFLLEGLSLTNLCNSIEPIKGYITGRVNGIGMLKGSGTGIDGLIGKAHFWAYSSEGDKTEISREFLRKIGGPTVKAYLGDRRFDKGVMNAYVQKGFFIFKELEISNKNFFGMQDLSVKVAPFNNRISIDHLLWTVTEAAHRAKAK